MAQSLADFLSANPSEGTISSRPPTVYQRQTDAFRNALFSDDRAGQEKANRLMNWLDVTGANIPALGYDLGQSAAQGDVGSLALTAGIGALPVIGRKLRSNSMGFLRDEAGMFMGEQSRTANKSALAVAKDMHEAGAPRESIFKETGWFRSPDGKWKYEIPSDKAEFTEPTKKYTSLQDVYSHPGLYESYPQLRTMAVKSESIPGAAGAFDPNSKAMMLSNQPGGFSRKSVLDHEVQHAVQNIEGWEGGTSPNPTLAFTRGTTANQVFLQKKSALERQLGRTLSPAERDSLARQSADEGYQRSAGEVESLNTQSRARGDYSKAPWETQDVSDSQQLHEQPAPGILDTLLGKFSLNKSFGKRTSQMALPARPESYSEKADRLESVEDEHFKQVFGKDFDKYKKYSKSSRYSNQLSDLAEEYDKKTPGTYNRIYGIGMNHEELPEFWRDMHKATSDITSINDPKSLIDESYWAMRDLPSDLNTNKLDQTGKIAIARMNAAMDKAKEMGMSKESFFKNIFARSIQSEGNNAPELMKSRFAALQGMLK